MKKTPTFDRTRRDLIAAAPAVALTVGLAGSAFAQCAGYGHQRVARLSIGYMKGSERWDYLHGLTPTLQAVTEEMKVDEAPLVAANALIGGDGAFARRGARVTVHGLLAEPPKGLPAMAMAAHYRPFHDAQHHAWAFEGSATCCAQPATSLTLPVDGGTGLNFSFEVRPRGVDGVAVEPAVAEASFGLGLAPGQAKLRRGVYLIAWDLPEGRALPTWGRYRAVAERIETPEEGMPETRRFMLTDASGAPKKVPALMLSVDYADAGTA